MVTVALLGWRYTLKEDFLDDALYEDIDDLREELLGFLVYYNDHRPHTSLENLTPKEFIENEKNVTNYVACTGNVALPYLSKVANNYSPLI